MSQLSFTVEDRAGMLNESQILEEIRKNAPILEKIKAGEDCYRDSLGWLNPEEWAGEKWLARYESLARKVQECADVLVVIGIGGSNQGARAVIDAMEGKSSVKIVWAGNTLSAHSVRQVLEEIRGKRVYIDVIAKNFETLEPGMTFRIFRDFLREQDEEHYAEHVICTGTPGSHLEELCIRHGYEFLPFPENIGGRFTALSPIGLFPCAVAGLDIRAMAEGGKVMHDRLFAEQAPENTALRFAVIRNLLYRRGFRMEMLAFFEPRLMRFARWWMQLFGESEGKENRGLYPVFAGFSEDLHSLGQFLQEGTPVIFETFLEVRSTGASYVIHDDDVDDRFHYLDGWDVDAVNRAACEATVEAHSGRYPCMRISVPAVDEKSFGELFYFFQFVCYISAEMLGVNPFDQPGVEAYKANMFRALGK